MLSHKSQQMTNNLKYYAQSHMSKIWSQLADKELSELLSEYPTIHADILGLFKEPEAAKPRKQLCDVTPLIALETNSAQVEDLLYRIKTGDFS